MLYKSLALIVGFNPVCLLEICIQTHQLNFQKVKVGCSSTADYLWESTEFQMATIANQRQKMAISAIVTDMELNFGVEVTKTHVQSILESLTGCVRF